MKKRIAILLASAMLLTSALTGKEESEKVGLKLNIQKTKIMASNPTTSWEIDGAQENKVCHCFHCFPSYLP